MDDESLEIACENLMDYNSSDSFDSPVTPPNSSERIIRGRGREREILNNNLAYENHRTCCHRCGNLRRHNVLCSECPYTFCARCSNKMLQEHGFDIFKNGCPVCKHLCCCGPNKSLNCPRLFHCYKKCPKTKALKEMDQNSSSAMESPLDDTERSTERHALDVLRFPSNNSHSRIANPQSSNSSISSSFASNASALSTLYQSTFSPTTNHQVICPPLGKLLLQGSEERHEAPAMLPLFTPITPTSSSPEKEKNNNQPRQTATRNSHKRNIYKNSLPHIDQAYCLTSTLDDECGRKLEVTPILNISDRKRHRATTSTVATATTNTTQYYSDMDSKNLPNSKHARIHNTSTTTMNSHDAVEANLQHQHTHSSPSFDLSDTFLDDDFDFLDALTSNHEFSGSSRIHGIATNDYNITEYSSPSPPSHYHHDHRPRIGKILMNNDENTEYDNKSSSSPPLSSDSVFGNEDSDKYQPQQMKYDNFHSPNNYNHYSTSTATTSTNINESINTLLTPSNLIVTSTEDSKTERITPMSTLSDSDSQSWKTNFLDPSFLSPLKSIDTLNLRSDFMFASSDGSLISHDNFHSDDDSATWQTIKDDSDIVSS